MAIRETDNKTLSQDVFDDEIINDWIRINDAINHKISTCQSKIKIKTRKKNVRWLFSYNYWRFPAKLNGQYSDYIREEMLKVSNFFMLRLICPSRFIILVSLVCAGCVFC